MSFNEMSSSNDVFFIREDNYGNSYFIFYYEGNLKPLQIYKYSIDLKLIEIYDDMPYLPVKNNFPTIKSYLIDDDGNIFFMDLNKESINILKWADD